MADMKMIEQAIGEMTKEELDTTLALIHRKMCITHSTLMRHSCTECPWRASILCLPVRKYLWNVLDEMNEVDETNEDRIDF